jgi:Zn finger protein HypA/HybF involved in hydrogenase expression
MKLAEINDYDVQTDKVSVNAEKLQVWCNQVERRIAGLESSLTAFCPSCGDACLKFQSTSGQKVGICLNCQGLRMAK